VHVCRNLIAKVPTHAQDQVKGDYWAIFDGIEAEGEAAIAEGRRRAKQFIAKWQPLYPAAVGCVATTSTRSWSTCCSRPSTASASATPT
jgi:transposase-like protein